MSFLENNQTLLYIFSIKIVRLATEQHRQLQYALLHLLKKMHYAHCQGLMKMATRLLHLPVLYQDFVRVSHGTTPRHREQETLNQSLVQYAQYGVHAPDVFAFPQCDEKETYVIQK